MLGNSEKSVTEGGGFCESEWRANGSSELGRTCLSLASGAGYRSGMAT